ncbi:MAG: hydroxymyristoyl-ACP dehydratase [Pseudomonadota bacterium]|nr:hydroxymyristoyl-ACP dehydratase [Pseudomonadota bacterium]
MSFAAAAGQGRDWIAARIPHQGRMCLLDGVTSASADAITCTARSHRAPDNPLRQSGRLGAACGIEYAAQAMALHGALRADMHGTPKARSGMLISVRQVALHVTRLDDIAEELTVSATCDSDNGDHCVYAFQLNAAGRALLQGRAVVMLDAGQGAD